MKKGQRQASNANDAEAKLRKLLPLARKGDEQAVKEVFDMMPTMIEAAGDMALQVEYSWFKTIARDDTLVHEAMRRTLSTMKAELAGACPTPLENLLVDRILACWLQMQYVDIRFAQRNQKGLSWEAIRTYQVWQDRAQRRYLSAIRALATIRRLELPAVQVNIGEKQVNVVGPGGRPALPDPDEEPAQ